MSQWQCVHGVWHSHHGRVERCDECKREKGLLFQQIQKAPSAEHYRLNQPGDDEIEQKIQTLETRVEELERALAGVRELMGEEHSYWACYPAQGPHNAVLRDYTKAWCKLIDRLIEGETFEEFTLVDEVDKYFKKEQHR